MVNFIYEFEDEYSKIWSEPDESELGEAIEGIVTKALYDKFLLLY